ncbi:pentatricopeptide repeat-containing protein At4g21300 [Lolium rigidum]|uniref:pentatricopeptide repeat-containing protein At4g21300 n=1 Tax=Lolium rigidum TaxID=89674 RepID=UPI001F5C6975|nr:pentatricopeptide repeat-containing protein At4g21300 [Lolium rigidum]
MRRLLRRRSFNPPQRKCLHAAFSTTASSATVTAGTCAYRLLALLRGCVAPTHLPLGLRIHARAVTSGLLAVADGPAALQTRLIGMYVLTRRFRDAVAVFSSLPRAAAAAALPWNWIIRGLTMAGHHRFAVLFFVKMWAHPAAPLPDGHTLPYVVKSCAALGALSLGRLVHRTARDLGLDHDMYVGSALIKMYADAGLLGGAREVFDEMDERDCVLWNVMMDGYVKAGDVASAVGLFKSMRASGCDPNFATLACFLSVCAAEADLMSGVQLHTLAVKYGLEPAVAVANTLVSMYGKCQCLDDAWRLFGLMPKDDLVTWNGMISGCVQNGLVDDALRLFCDMQKTGIQPDSVTLASLLPALTDLSGFKQGKEMHGYIVRNCMHVDVFLVSALVDIYFKCRDVRMAQNVFDATKTIDVVIGSTMISGYVLNGMSEAAVKMFRYLLELSIKPNAVVVATMLPACASMSAMKLGQELHGYVLKNAYEGKCYLESALMDMYAKCGRLDLSHYIFSKMSAKDEVTWNSMISSFAQNGEPEAALDLFRQMSMEGIEYNNVTISSILSACAGLPAIYYGKEVHGIIIKGPIRADVFAESALIDMYGKCGNLELALRVFKFMPEKNEVSWNSIISAYGAHGLVKESVSLLSRMQEEGFKADHVTFLALISACAHAGQVQEGLRLFRCMTEEYEIAPRVEHLACMVDLYSRAGKLDKAMQFIADMPFKPDAGIWGALLHACRVHRNVELAEIASQELFKLDPHNSGYYVLMSNINAVAGRWDGVSKMRRLMKDKKVQKIPGYSWVDINNTSHLFVAADKSHPDSEDIYMSLKSLLLELKHEGYVPSPDICDTTQPDNIDQVMTI